MNLINDETVDVCIESLTAQIVDSYAENQGIPVTESIQMFLSTKTFALLTNPDSYLFLESAPYVEDMLDAELSGDWDRWLEV